MSHVKKTMRLIQRSHIFINTDVNGIIDFSICELNGQNVPVTASGFIETHLSEATFPVA